MVEPSYVRNVRTSDDLLSTTEVAALCGVAAMTVVRWIDNGALPAVRTPGGWRRVRRADAERHAAKVAGRGDAPTLEPEALASFLVTGNREAVVTWARAHAGTGTSVGDLVLTHLAPAMRQIGDGWECGELSVAEEHRATGLMSDLLVLLREVLPAPVVDRARAPRLLMVCAEGELHALAARMAAERFTDAGWRLDALGADVPAAEVVLQIESTAPNAVGVSVTSAISGARSVLRSIAKSGWTGPVLVGGGAAAEVALRRPRTWVDDGSHDFVERATSQIANVEGQDDERA